MNSLPSDTNSEDTSQFQGKNLKNNYQAFLILLKEVYVSIAFSLVPIPIFLVFSICHLLLFAFPFFPSFIKHILELIGLFFLLFIHISLIKEYLLKTYNYKSNVFPAIVDTFTSIFRSIAVIISFLPYIHLFNLAIFDNIFRPTYRASCCDHHSLTFSFIAIIFAILAIKDFRQKKKPNYFKYSLSELTISASLLFFKSFFLPFIIQLIFYSEKANLQKGNCIFLVTAFVLILFYIYYKKSQKALLFFSVACISFALVTFSQALAKPDLDVPVCPSEDVYNLLPPPPKPDLDVPVYPSEGGYSVLPPP